jgi:hypothetical protein
MHVLYPELDGKRSGTPVLTELLVTEGCWLRLMWTLKNWYSRIQLNSWCDEYEDLLQLEETLQ